MSEGCVEGCSVFEVIEIVIVIDVKKGKVFILMKVKEYLKLLMFYLNYLENFKFRKGNKIYRVIF